MQVARAASQGYASLVIATAYLEPNRGMSLASIASPQWFTHIVYTEAALGTQAEASTHTH
jgi:hypothetical protein